MIVRNASREVIEHAAAHIMATVVNQSRDPRRVVLRPRPGSDHFRRTSASGFRPGRRVNAICWHGHRDFFRVLFQLAPGAIVVTALARYTADTFEETFPGTDRNIGSRAFPILHSQACLCEPERPAMVMFKQSDILKCPHTIIDSSHYRPDGTCRCNDRTHTIMAAWGYKWNGKAWVG